MVASVDVVILGCGLIGLAIARELARRGYAVSVVDPGEPVRAASWAAAGMLAPGSEEIENPVLLSLCSRSLNLYPAYAAALLEETGIDINLMLDGIAIAAMDEGPYADLKARADRLRAHGIAHRMLSAAEARSREPALAASCLGGLEIQGEGQVDNRRLGQALFAACITAGVRIVASAGNVAIEADSRRVRGVRTAYGFLTAPAIVNAAGAWSAHVPGLPDRVRPPVFPIKGQMAAFHQPARFVRHVTWVPGAYLVPRRDGRLLVGASVERAGFDVSVTPAVINALLEAARNAMPPLRELEVTETWAGLRPGTPDGLPIIGETELEGLYDASGHARNGVLMTPVTALAVADAIDGKPPAPDVAAVSPRRAVGTETLA